MDMSWSDAKDTLREWRDSNIRDSERVIEIGERLVRNYSSKLGDELWLVCEQVYVAALDTCRYDVADMCMEKLHNNFPNSCRVRKLDAMRFEALGEYSEALKIYEELEKEEPTDAAIKKRMIAVSKITNRDSAIKQLTVYLQTFMADQDAWMELADLYIEQMDYSKAAFCLEELILSNAFNHLYHQRYAEIKYSQGGDDNIKLARQYFAQAVKLSSNSNMRALYGLLLTSSRLSKSSSKEGNNKQYVLWASKMISQKYKAVWADVGGTVAGGLSIKLAPSTDIPQLMACVDEMLEELHLTENNS